MFPPDRQPETPRAALRSLLVSLLFWLVLLTAGGCYAAVALAPKLVVWRDWDRRHRENQLELVALESRCTQLEQVIAALKHDPQFAAEMVRLEFDALAPGEEVIPVGRALALQPPAQEPVPRSHVAWEVGDPWLSALASEPTLRRVLLVSAAILVLAAFTFLQDGNTTGHREPPRSAWTWLRERYRRTQA